jgi:DNA-binding LytR/AlgR family response regulator
MEVTNNAQAAQSLNALHQKRSDAAIEKLNEEDRSKQLRAAIPNRPMNTPMNVPMCAPIHNEVFLKVDNRLIRFSLDEFLYLENVGDYVSIKTTKGSYMVHATMKTMEMKLSHPAFVKVHRSYIINISKIAYIEDNAILIDKKNIPISRAHKSELLERLNVL